MTSTIFVTGATGQTGGNVCEQLIERGDHVGSAKRAHYDAYNVRLSKPRSALWKPDDNVS